MNAFLPSHLSFSFLPKRNLKHKLSRTFFNECASGWQFNCIKELLECPLEFSLELKWFLMELNRHPDPCRLLSQNPTDFFQQDPSAFTGTGLMGFVTVEQLKVIAGTGQASKREDISVCRPSSVLIWP